jgi:hypothetical protein
MKMGGSKEKQVELAEFQPDTLEKLSIQDALIIIAVYAVQADTEKCNHINILAQKHPLFEEKPEDTSARVNKFTNLMQANRSLEAVEAAVAVLKLEYRKIAFELAAEAALSDNGLSGKKKKILGTLAAKLALRNEFVEQTLARKQLKK